MHQPWTPIPLEELYNLVLQAENDLRGELQRLWELVKIFPEKWAHESYGPPEGFWVVAVCGRRIIWYNDIEEYFCTSEYTSYGRFAGQASMVGALPDNVRVLWARIQLGG